MMNDQTPRSTSLPHITLGISACLMGDEVRYNGGHTQSKLCTHALTNYFHFEKFCPEVAAGFGIPRPTMRLIGDPASPILTSTHGEQEDLTQQLLNGIHPQLPKMSHLDGYILMKNSPSCGLSRIKVYQENGYAHETKVSGLFTRALKDKYPLLPMEEEGRLNDAALRENFILRVYAYYHFKKDVLSTPSYHNLLNYHRHYKLLLMAHDQNAYRILGKMLGDSHDKSLIDLIPDYFQKFMSAIQKPASRGGHTNALQHVLSFIKKDLDKDARQDIAHIIEQYYSGIINLITPMTLLNHYVQQLGSPYIRAQRYLEPYPPSLGLRNQI